MPPDRCLTSVLVVSLSILAGCGGKSSHHHTEQADAISAPPAKVEPVDERPTPPSIEQTRQEFAAEVTPQIAAKIRQRLNTSAVKEKLVLAVAVPADDSAEMVESIIEKLKSDPQFSDDFAVVASHADADNGMPSGLVAPPSAQRSPDGRAPEKTVYDPDSIYVLTPIYNESRGEGGDEALSLRCRVTHPQTRELNMQITLTRHQTFDGHQWRLVP